MCQSAFRFLVGSATVNISITWIYYLRVGVGEFWARDLYVERSRERYGTVGHEIMSLVSM